MDESSAIKKAGEVVKQVRSDSDYEIVSSEEVEGRWKVVLAVDGEKIAVRFDSDVWESDIDGGGG